MSQIFQSKALLAKLLATENLIIEQRPTETASFDLKTRTLTIPILKNSLTPQEYDLFIGHEVGHALFTPMEDWIDSVRIKKVPKGILNVVEDARIERKIKVKYPGLKNSFVRSYKGLFYDGFFGVNEMKVNELNFIDRANLLFKVGPFLGIKFKNEEEENFLKEIEMVETFDQVIELSKRIAEYMRKEVQDFKIPKHIKYTLVQSDEKEETDSRGNDSIETIPDIDQLIEELENLLDEQNDPKESDEDEAQPSKGQSDEDSTDKGSSNSDDVGDVEEDTKDEDSTEPAKTAGKVSDLPEEQRKEVTEDLIDSQTDDAYHENEKKLFDSKAQSPIYVNIPDIDPSNVIIPYKRLIRKIRETNIDIHEPEKMAKLNTYAMDYTKSISKVVSYLVKEFELRKNADVQKRARISKTGEINTNMLHSYKFSEDIFKRLTNLPEGKSHGLVLFLDWSGSMKNTIGSTIRQLISLVLFCKKVNIPFEVYAFADKFWDDQGLPKITTDHNTFKHRDLKLTEFNLVNLFSSKMTASEFKYMSTILVSQLATHYTKGSIRMGGTPLNEAAICAMNIIPKFKKENRLQIVNTVFLTDGESNTLTNFWNKKSGPYGDTVASSFSNRTLMLKDPVTRHEVKIEPTNDGDSWRVNGVNLTKAVMSLLKHRTGCNIVGFYLVDTRNFGNAIPYFKHYSEFDKKKKEFLADKYVIAESVGYDEFYIIKDEDQTIVDFNDIETTASTRSILSAFKKHSFNKIQSRTILNRFIHMIT